MKMIVASRGAAVADEAAFLAKANIARCPTLLQQPRAKAFVCCKHIRVPQAFVQGRSLPAIIDPSGRNGMN
jgi:hypothetical protein